MRYGVALSAKSIHGRRFHETTVIVVSPRYVLRNDTQYSLLVRQATVSSSMMTLFSGSSRAWHWPNRLASPMLVLSLLGGDDGDLVEYFWSGVRFTFMFDSVYYVFVIVKLNFSAWQ